jgi:uncharacterized membrane protein
VEKETMSITTVPITEAVDQPGLLDKITTFIASAKVASSDGLTWSEFGELLLALLRLVVSALDSVATLSGSEKKAMAIDAVARLFDAVADYAVPVTLYPIWLVARPAVRSLVLALAGGVLEQLLPLVRLAR